MDPTPFGDIARRGSSRIRGVVGRGRPTCFSYLGEVLCAAEVYRGAVVVEGAEFEVRGLAGLVSEDWEWIMKWPLEIPKGVAEVMEY